MDHDTLNITGINPNDLRTSMTGGLREEADTRIACSLTRAGDKPPAFAALFSACERGLAAVVFIGWSVLRRCQEKFKVPQPSARRPQHPARLPGT